MAPSPLAFTAAAAAFSLLAVVGTALLVTRPTSDAAPGVADLASVCPVTEPAGTTSAGEPPLGAAIVCLDGSVGSDLGLPRDAWTPDLSPDGARVAFRTSDLSIGSCGACRNAPYLAVLGLGETAAAFLTHGDGPPFEPAQFAWSPDGGRIAFQAVQDDNLDIYVLDLDDDSEAPSLSGEITRLTTDPAFDEYPAWTPDGSTILYANMGATGPDESGYSPTQEIWSVPATGGTPTRLTDNLEADTGPDVAADGTVAFWRAGETWTMNVDGSDQERAWHRHRLLAALVAGRLEARAPALRPHGTDGRRSRRCRGRPFRSSRSWSSTWRAGRSSMSGHAWPPTTTRSPGRLDGEGLLINRYDDGS